MKSRKQVLKDVKKVFAASFVDGKLDLETVRSVVRKLSETKPRGYQTIINAYWRLVRLEIEKNKAVVESVEELDASTKKSVSAELQKKYGDQVEVEFALNPELIGGMRIRIGSDVWDGSVKNRIQRLEEKFN